MPARLKSPRNKIAARNATSGKRSPDALTLPQELPLAARKRAIEGIPASKARAIVRSEPVSAKKMPGKTVKPLAPERIAAILDALAKTYPNVVCALIHRNVFD